MKEKKRVLNVIGKLLALITCLVGDLIDIIKYDQSTQKHSFESSSTRHRNSEFYLTVKMNIIEIFRSLIYWGDIIERFEC